MRAILILTSVLACAAPAISGQLSDDAAECKRLGFVKGTDSFLQCLQLAAKEHERAKAQADAQEQAGREQAQIEADRRAKCLAALSNPGPGMQGQSPGQQIMGAYQQGYVSGSIERWCH